MSAARSMLCALAIALAIPASAAVAQDAIKGITIDDAKRLSDIEFAQRLMSLLSLGVVDVDRSQILQDQAIEINVALRAKPVWNGVCGSTILRFMFPEEAASKKSATPTDLDTVMFYKIRGNTDQNSSQDDVAFQAVCAADHPFRSGYFTAPDGRTAQAAGMIIQIVQAELRRPRRSFQISCRAGACPNASERIAKVSADQVRMVGVSDHCEADRTCVKISFLDDSNCWESWSVVARYKAPPGKKWGIARPQSLRLEPKECPGPAL